MGKILLMLAAFCSFCIVPAFAGLTQPAEPAIHSTAPLPDLDKPSWRTFTSVEGRFSLMVPTTPISRTHTLHTNGTALHQFFCRTNGEVYIFQYLDKSIATIQRLSAEKMLTINDAALLKISKGTLVSKRQITLDGYPGHEMIVLQSGGWKQTQRTFLVGNRAYVLGVDQPQTDPITETTDADKFLNSFTLLSAKLPDRK